MDDTTYYLMWCITQLLALAAACLLFWLDQKVKREGEQGRRTRWFQRGFFVAGWIFLVPFLGVQVPQLMITLFVFHGSVLPSSPDFSYQLFTHSLSIILWLSLFSYGLTILLGIYAMYLGIRGALSQREQQKKRK